MISSKKIYDKFKHQFLNGACYLTYDDDGRPFLFDTNYGNEDDFILFYSFHSLINHLINEDGYDFLSIYTF